MQDNKVPVLFLVFNRPETTMRVFAKIKKYKPTQLFIAADGPRVDKSDDIKKCSEVRNIVNEVDWPCKVERLYRAKNVGCKKATSSAINWFFMNVKEGIILEDDCVPDTSFFQFCETMLEKYRNRREVFHIGGNNFLPRQNQRSDSYYFSKYPNTWGWASWRRAWKHYDFNMKNWPELAKGVNLDKYWDSFWEQQYWTTIFNLTYHGKNDAWDYQWVYTIWANGGLSITPGVNLVENIGLNRSGTHINTNTKVLGVKAQSLRPNPKLLGDNYSKLADEYASKHVYRISPVMVFVQWAYYLLKSTKV